MPRYIDADALIESIKNELWDWDSLDGITSATVLKQTITDIQNTPTADVVEVVRCKDCIYSQDRRACSLPYGENGYCPLGERREITGKAGEKEKTEYEEQQGKSRSEEGSGDLEA